MKLLINTFKWLAFVALNSENFDGRTFYLLYTTINN